MLHSPLRPFALALVLGSGLSAAFAGKPQWVEDGQHRKEAAGRAAQGPGGGVSLQIQIGGYFNDSQRQALRAPAGCPPGLAKKGNGCLPPGQAKRWRLGQPLPRDLVYHPVPASVQVQLGTPPAGHKFVRVATDILLIAIGTGMVIDAIEDLGRL